MFGTQPATKKTTTVTKHVREGAPDDDFDEEGTIGVTQRVIKKESKKQTKQLKEAPASTTPQRDELEASPGTKGVSGTDMIIVNETDQDN